MKSVFSWISLVTGILPGIAIILSGFGTPEEFRKPFGIIAGVCGFTAFGLIALIKERVKRRNKKRLAGIIIAFGVIGLTSICGYWLILSECVFDSPNRTSVFFPLWLSGRAKEDVDSAGGRRAFYERYGAGAVSTLLDTQSNEFDGTKLLLLLLIVVASIALPVSSGLAPALRDSR